MMSQVIHLRFSSNTYTGYKASVYVLIPNRICITLGPYNDVLLQDGIGITSGLCMYYFRTIYKLCITSLYVLLQDRILFRARTKNSIACLCYDSVPSMRDSDHKPVYGLYEVLLRPGIDSYVMRELYFVSGYFIDNCTKL